MLDFNLKSLSQKAILVLLIVFFFFSPAALALVPSKAQKQASEITGLSFNFAYAQDVGDLPMPQTSTVSKSSESDEESGTGYIVRQMGWLITLVPLQFYHMGEKIFNWSFNNVVLDFAGWYNSLGLKAGVENAWKISRDFANIVIISMFVFSAVATILRIQSFELKTFIVYIIIVALLINFSIFFVKFAVDFSNALAYQFYKQIKYENNEMKGPASVLAEKLKIGSVINDEKSIDRIIEKNKGKGGYIWINAFVSFILISVLLCFAGGVFLYGAFVMFSRFLGLLLVMALSAIGFVMLIVPEIGKKYFNMWWQNLLRYAIFAPLFSLMLIVIISIVGPLKIDAASLIGGLSDNFVGSLFSVFLLVGLFYGAIFISNSLSIAGSNFASKWAFGGAATLGTLPFTLPSNYLRRAFWGGVNRLPNSWKSEYVRYKAEKEARKNQHFLGDYAFVDKLNKKLGFDAAIKKSDLKKGLQPWEKRELSKMEEERERKRSEKSGAGKAEELIAAAGQVEKRQNEGGGGSGGSAALHNIRSGAEEARSEAQGVKSATQGAKQSAGSAENEMRQASTRAEAAAEAAGAVKAPSFASTSSSGADGAEPEPTVIIPTPSKIGAQAKMSPQEDAAKRIRKLFRDNRELSESGFAKNMSGLNDADLFNKVREITDKQDTAQLGDDIAKNEGLAREVMQELSKIVKDGKEREDSSGGEKLSENPPDTSSTSSNYLEQLDENKRLLSELEDNTELLNARAIRELTGTRYSLKGRWRTSRLGHFVNSKLFGMHGANTRYNKAVMELVGDNDLRAALKEQIQDMLNHRVNKAIVARSERSYKNETQEAKRLLQHLESLEAGRPLESFGNPQGEASNMSDSAGAKAGPEELAEALADHLRNRELSPDDPSVQQLKELLGDKDNE